MLGLLALAGGFEGWAYLVVPASGAGAVVEDVLVIPRLEADRLPFEPRPFELRPVVQQW